MTEQSKYVKLTNESTCRIVADLTKDPSHFGKCPITMSREKWDSIKHYVRFRKEQKDKPASDILGSIFGDIFKRQ